MDEYFTREINNIERELVSLKTSIVKSGTTITAASKSISYSVTLSLNHLETVAAGYAYFKVTVDNSAIITVSLDKYIDDLTKIFIVGAPTRFVTYSLRKLSDSEYIVIISAIGDQDDISTIRNGGSVSLTGTLTVVCTDSFTLEAI